MAFFEHDGIRFHYRITGEGPAVVFNHGLTGDLTNIEELIGELPGHRLLLWDARAHGETTPAGPPRALNFVTFARDLNALLSHLEIEKAVVGGVSMGAATATRLALDYPERIAALVLVRPAWLDQPLPQALRLYPKLADCLEQYGPRAGKLELEKLSEYQTLLETSLYDAQGLMDQFDRPFTVERSARLRNIPRDCPIRNWEEVKDLNLPALVVGNDQDLVHPLCYAQRWAERLPRAEFVQVPSRPKDFNNHARAFREHLARFLAAVNW